METIPKNYMLDARGNLVHKKNIKPIDLERDNLVKDLWKHASMLEASLEAFKQEALLQIQELIQKSANEHAVVLGGRKGNVSLTSFDGEYKIIRAINERISFTEELQVAQSLIHEYLHELTKNTKIEIRALIDNAFQIDKDGNVSAARILALRRVNIENEKWQKAMKIIGDAIKIESSKEYIRFYRRNAAGNYDRISMNFSE